MLTNFISNSISISINLSKPFDFTSNTIKNTITNMHTNLLTDDRFFAEIKKCHKLNKFLGKKRGPNKSLTSEEIEELKDDLKDKTLTGIEISETNKLFKLTIDEDNNEYFVNFLKKPFLIYKIFDNFNRIDIDLFTDNIAYKAKLKELSNFDYDVYFIYKNELKSSKSLKEFEKMENDNIIIREDNKDDKLDEKENEKKELIISPFLIVINSLIPAMNDEDLKISNIYHDINYELKLIQPNDISKKYFYYFTIDKNSQEKYSFILTDERKKFIEFLENYIELGLEKNIRFIVGPKGAGKTSTLIFFSFIQAVRVFYANLEALKKNKNDSKKIDLLMELAKLYGPYANVDKGKSKNEIENYISNNYSELETLELLLTIVEKFIPFANQVKKNFCIIIDQISLSDTFGNIETLFNIMKIVSQCTYLKLIVCSTINNNTSKESMNSSFNDNMSKKSNDLYDYYYFQNFFSSNDITEYILKEENDIIIDVMNELGNLPGHYYELKRLNNVEQYLNYLEQNINDNMNVYYGSKKIVNILELLDLVCGEKLLSGSLLRERIKKIPLKYLIIKKFKINNDFIQKYQKPHENDDFVKYLNLLIYDSANKKCDAIFNDYYNFLEIDSDKFLENYFERDVNSRNFFGDFYGDYIKNNEKALGKPQEEIYIYKIEFSMNFIQKVLFNIIHEEIEKEYQIFLNFFSNGVLGGFFEVLINFALIKNNFKLFNKSIDQITNVDRIVPYQFSIKNFSSKRNAIKFKQFKLAKNKKKRKLLFKNTYIFQRIFNSKYYDSAILLITDTPGVFDIILIQTTIKKDKDKRFNKYEHEIIISYVKKYLENLLDIKIRKAYFFYILSEKNGEIEDLETKKDCDQIGIKYLGYDIKKKEFSVNFSLDEAFITDKFLIHNSVSLFNFKELKDNDINERELITGLNFNNFINIKESIFNLLKILLKNRENSEILKQTQFKYKNFTDEKDTLSKINVPLSPFCIYLIKKQGKTKEKIFIKFIDKYYKYANEKFNITDININDMDKIYIIYSEIPLDLKN